MSPGCTRCGCFTGTCVCALTVRVHVSGYRWALGILLSRLVRLDAAPSKSLWNLLEPLEPFVSSSDAVALVPWADFVNHSSGCRSHLFLDRSMMSTSGARGAVVLQTDREYIAGQQVYVNYGEKASSELLLSYGFVPVPGTNPYDAVLFRIEVRPSLLLCTARRGIYDLRVYRSSRLCITSVLFVASGMQPLPFRPLANTGAWHNQLLQPVVCSCIRLAQSSGKQSIGIISPK